MNVQRVYQVQVAKCSKEYKELWGVPKKSQRVPKSVKEFEGEIQKRSSQRVPIRREREKKSSKESQNFSKENESIWADRW